MTHQYHHMPCTKIIVGFSLSVACAWAVAATIKVKSKIDLIDPPFNSNRNYEAFWGETKEKRSFEDRHESTKAYIDYMRPRWALDELAREVRHPFDPSESK
jgi:hypothetical protein